MNDYTIKNDRMEYLMRQGVDQAVHMAIARFSDDLGEFTELTHRIARAAAESAVEQFRSYCNAELRLIQVDHEERASRAMLNPLSPESLQMIVNRSAALKTQER